MTRSTRKSVGLRGGAIAWWLAAALAAAGCGDSGGDGGGAGAGDEGMNGGGSGGSQDDADLFNDTPACNHIDDPGSCDGWVCYQDESGTICERTRNDYPDSRPGWECTDDANPGYTTCIREDSPGGGGGGWVCMDDANGDLSCTRDDHGGYDNWDCTYTDDGIECIRTDGPGGVVGWDCVDDANGTTCTSDDPSHANDSPGGGQWECVTDNDTRICNDDHDDDEPGRARDNPTGTDGWTCEDTNDGRVCVADDPGGDGPGVEDPDEGYDTPDHGESWDCIDYEGERICVRDDPGGGEPGGMAGDNPGGGGAGWDCEYDDATDTTICVGEPDTPTDDGDWECYEEPGRRVCSDDSPDNPGGGDPVLTDCGDPTGNLRGRVCAPSGDFWVVGATVSVTYTDCNGDVVTLSTQTDAQGYFLIAGIPEGTYQVSVRKGPYRRTYRATITAGETTTIPLGDLCFDQSTAIAVVTGRYDQIERVLDRLGFTYSLFDGYPENNGTRELLGDLDRMRGFDVIFMNCGTTFRGIFDNPMIAAVVEDNLREYVAGGGRLYVSDWDWLFWESASPDSFDFHGGDDTSQADVLQGHSGYRPATVLDPELRAALGEDRVTLNFDYPNWAVIESVAADSRVFLRADIELVRGGVMRDVPVLVSRRVGEGEVVFTSYHIHENQAINAIFSYTVFGFE
ncbi:MAG: hypothetical protein CMH57_11385 [Myxococcales bacterium]|nr:hypothetical protein [Myxococcales bacterium]